MSKTRTIIAATSPWENLMRYNLYKPLRSLWHDTVTLNKRCLLLLCVRHRGHKDQIRYHPRPEEVLIYISQGLFQFRDSLNFSYFKFCFPILISFLTAKVISRKRMFIAKRLLVWHRKLSLPWETALIGDSGNHLLGGNCCIPEN